MLHADMIRNKKIVIFTAMLLLGACSQSTMQIATLNAKLIYIQSADNYAVPRLSVFLRYENRMGQNDFNELKIIHRETGLSWTLCADQLSFFKNNELSENNFIIGSNKIAFPYNTILSGEYIVLLSKLNQKKLSKSFYLAVPQNIIEHFPVETFIENKTVKFSSAVSLSKVKLLLLGADKQIFYSQTLHEQSFDAVDLTDFLNKYRDTHFVQFLFEINGIEYISKIIKVE